MVRNATPVLGEVSLDRQDLRLAQGEIDVERIGLDDRRELGRPGDADERADIDEVIGDDAVKRSEHLGVAEVDLGEPDGGLARSGYRPPTGPTSTWSSGSVAWLAKSCRDSVACRPYSAWS